MVPPLTSSFTLMESLDAKAKQVTNTMTTGCRKRDLMSVFVSVFAIVGRWGGCFCKQIIHE